MRNRYVVVTVVVALALGLLVGIQLGFVSVEDGEKQETPVSGAPAEAPSKPPETVKTETPKPAAQPPPSPGDSVAAAEAEADKQWARLTSEAVERVCAEKVKEKAGPDAWAVFGCTCAGTESENRKEFECTIETIQGGIPTEIACVRSTKRCVLRGQGQESLLSLEEITREL